MVGHEGDGMHVDRKERQCSAKNRENDAIQCLGRAKQKPLPNGLRGDLNDKAGGNKTR